MWGLSLLFLAQVGLNPLPFVAGLIGTTEPALKLLLSILMAYPLALVYEEHVRKQTPKIRNLFFIFTGVDMAFFNFGLSMYHNIIPAVVIYVSTKVLGPGKWNAIFSFVFNMTYLVVGYVVTESEDYDITWTMPHCVLTLKLIALTFDLWDGDKMQREDEISMRNMQSAVVVPPTLLEILGFLYFPASFLVGPIFSFRRYKEYINDHFPLETGAVEIKEQSIKRFLQGLAYLAAFQIGVTVFNINYMMSDEFLETSIFYRHFYCGLWGHFALYKYISCWLLTEASCIRFGLSYNGMKMNERGQETTTWDACNNIKPFRFESATKFQHYIDSFNCNTNRFAADYVYKRLKFLQNRSVSQILTLVFLAVWHGTQSGYYATFFNEFIIMVMEKDLEAIISKTQLYHDMWDNSYGRFVLYAVLKIYTIVFMGWSLVPITLKTFSKWWQVYSALWFSGFLLFVPWAFVYKPLLIKVVAKVKKCESSAQ